ncbi:ADP-ribosylglycohydrolase family protein [Dactylosporangium sp. CA-233914]|uniref:ADP-ribosylglycohydrolase family protein n=1 Tax=Dactylosporangium sp. CA-233914 TaxID=3239934 RepID=UPI003D8C07D8
MVEYQGLEPLEPQLSPSARLRYEFEQRRETGYDPSGLEAQFAALPADPPAAMVWEIFDALDDLPRDPTWAFEEPDSRDDIVAALPADDSPPPSSDSRIEDRVHGGWLGRVAGCNLGKPVEGGKTWTRPVIRRYLESVDAYPLRDYVPIESDRYGELWFRDCWTETARGRIHGSARDDDLDYTIIGLHVLETYGREYTGSDVAAEWLSRLPVLLTFTAEIITIANLLEGVRPPATGGYRNPHREWIGAQIRADIHGFTNPGRPRAAALQTIEDATLSHRGNGVYGEMWAAALVAAAFTADGPRDAVVESLRHIPPRSRLAVAVRGVLESYDAGLGWDAALDKADAELGHYHWVHAVNNAAAVTAGLLWSEGDFTTAIGLTVQAGLDTDSNGATAGCVAGVLTGASGIPRHWVEPLDDRMRSAVLGYDGSRISELAARTTRIALS